MTSAPLSFAIAVLKEEAMRQRRDNLGPADAESYARSCERLARIGELYEAVEAGRLK